MRKGNSLTRGFTMIELLVLIAIIAVLAALLMPAAIGARAKGYEAACRSNMRQHYSAFVNYAGDHDGYFPGYESPPSVGAPCTPETKIIWQTKLVKEGYLEGWTNEIGNRGFAARGLDCPANVNGHYEDPRSPSGVFRNGGPDYMYNSEMGSDCDNTANMRLSAIATTSRKGLLFEGGNQYGYQAFRCAYTISGWPGYFDTNQVTYRIADPHANRSNVLMFDGHVASFDRGKIDWEIAALSLP